MEYDEGFVFRVHCKMFYKVYNMPTYPDISQLL